MTTSGFSSFRAMDIGPLRVELEKPRSAFDLCYLICGCILRPSAKQIRGGREPVKRLAALYVRAVKLPQLPNLHVPAAVSQCNEFAIARNSDCTDAAQVGGERARLRGGG